jgi:hypothetical protein
VIRRESACLSSGRFPSLGVPPATRVVRGPRAALRVLSRLEEAWMKYIRWVSFVCLVELACRHDKTLHREAETRRRTMLSSYLKWESGLLSSIFFSINFTRSWARLGSCKRFRPPTALQLLFLFFFCFLRDSGVSFGCLSSELKFFASVDQVRELGMSDT